MGASGCASSAAARYEQRIDSTLRGEPAEELAGLLEGARIGRTRWSSPSRRGRTRDACASAGASGRAGTEREIEVAPALFGDAPAEVVRPEALVERVRAGAVRRFVVDGERDEDLHAAAEAVDALDGTVVTASPGGWLRYHPLAARAGADFVLVVLSSNTELNHRQLRRCAPRRTGELGRAQAPAPSGGAAPCSSRRSPTSHPDDTHRDPRHADEAAAAAAALLADAHERGLRCRGVVASGGHLASRARRRARRAAALRGRRGRAAVRARDDRRRLLVGPARGDEGRPGRRR